MHITWYGHAAFLIETGETRIILDPYRSPDCGGYAPVDDTADLVVVSHENDRYHSHLRQIRPPFEVIRALELPPEGATFRGVEIRGIPVYETPEKLPGDEVAIILLRAEGLRVAFLGDLGHLLSPEELEPLRGSEIVLAAAGGPPTLDFPDLPPLIEAIGPRIMIPMHYKTPKIDLAIQPLERFLEAFPGWRVERPGGSRVEVAPAALPDPRAIVCLDYAR